MVKRRLLSQNAMDRLLREAGALRVSDSASNALSEALEEIALTIGQEAKKFAEHAGRKTITEKDIKLASKTTYNR